MLLAHTRKITSSVSSLYVPGEPLECSSAGAVGAIDSFETCDGVNK